MESEGLKLYKNNNTNKGEVQDGKRIKCTPALPGGLTFCTQYPAKWLRIAETTYTTLQIENEWIILFYVEYLF